MYRSPFFTRTTFATRMDSGGAPMTTLISMSFFDIGDLGTKTTTLSLAPSAFDVARATTDEVAGVLAVRRHTVRRGTRGRSFPNASHPPATGCAVLCRFRRSGCSAGRSRAAANLTYIPL